MPETLRRYRARIMADPYTFDPKLILFADTFDGLLLVSKGVNWVERNEGYTRTPDDGIEGGKEVIQSIMDQAWEAGFRPTNFQDVRNETTALKDHIKDLRALAFAAYNVRGNDV